MFLPANPQNQTHHTSILLQHFPPSNLLSLSQLQS
nr:MAG TPA: hypothetical protein [Crassvirales sp.]